MRNKKYKSQEKENSLNSFSFSSFFKEFPEINKHRIRISEILQEMTDLLKMICNLPSSCIFKQSLNQYILLYLLIQDASFKARLIQKENFGRSSFVSELPVYKTNFESKIKILQYKKYTVKPVLQQIIVFLRCRFINKVDEQRKYYYYYY